MDQGQREFRRAANQAFMESLNHLGMSLPISEGDPEVATPVKPLKPTVPIDLEDLEAAVADIENYMQIKEEAEAAPTDESV